MTAAAADRPLRVLELFAGIGGCAAALGDAAQVVAAVDINAQALAVYRHNFAHPTVCRTIESLPARQLAEWGADLWWLSPPCQPYTRKGKQRDVDDSRAAALLHLVDCIEHVRPQYVALENVPPFASSQARVRLVDMLERCGYGARETQLCPTELGVPNRRRRYYLLAALGQTPAIPPRSENRTPLAHYVDPAHDDDPQLELSSASAARFAAAIDVINAEDPAAVASCFTAAYGRSVVRSGSYLRTRRGLRRFAPAEIQNLLGLGALHLPPSLRAGWRLLGNSLSVVAVRHLLEFVRPDHIALPNDVHAQLTQDN